MPLRAGRDVVVPQFLGRVESVLALAQLCDDVGAQFVEVALLTDPQNNVERFTRRSAQPEPAEHRDAQALLERSGGIGALSEMHQRLLQVVASRPGTRTIVTVEGQTDRAYRDLLAHLPA